MYKRELCQIDKAWLKGRIQECVVDEDTGNVIAITGEDGDMADKLAMLLNKDNERLKSIDNLVNKLETEAFSLFNDKEAGVSYWNDLHKATRDNWFKKNNED